VYNNILQIISRLPLQNKQTSKANKENQEISQLLNDFRNKAVWYFSFYYDQIFIMEFEKIIEQQKDILEKLFCLYKDFGKIKNIKDVQLIKNKLKKYNEEEIEEGILINENERKSLIEWRQSIVAKELFDEIDTKNKHLNGVFKNKLIEGMLFYYLILFYFLILKLFFPELN